MQQPKDNGKVTISVPVGDVIDRLTILEIKKELIQSSSKLENINLELDSINADLVISRVRVGSELVDDLRETNRKIYNLMEQIFTQNLSDEQYARVSRETVDLNVVRANLKRHINSASSSQLMEERSYFD
jgi:hypothetical protein